MENETVNLKRNLNDFRVEHGFLQRVPCSLQENEEFRILQKEERPLPEGVFAYINEVDDPGPTEFYRLTDSDFSVEERKEYLVYKQLALLKTIKNCVLFFTILTIIGIVSSLILLLLSM